jgi:hypothetical protein
MGWPEALVYTIAILCGSVVALAWVVRNSPDKK